MCPSAKYMPSFWHRGQKPLCCPVPTWGMAESIHPSLVMNSCWLVQPKKSVNAPWCFGIFTRKTLPNLYSERVATWYDKIFRYAHLSIFQLDPWPLAITITNWMHRLWLIVAGHSFWYIVNHVTNGWCRRHVAVNSKWKKKYAEINV